MEAPPEKKTVRLGDLPRAQRRRLLLESVRRRVKATGVNRREVRARVYGKRRNFNLGALDRATQHEVLEISVPRIGLKDLVV